MARNVYAAENLFLDSLVEGETRRLDKYLNDIAKNFPVGTVHWRVQRGSPAEAIIESALPEKDSLIAMATHGRSGLNRWLLGSVAEKVLRGAANPLLLVRAKGSAPKWGAAALKSVIVPLDGSETAEKVLASTEVLATNLDLEVILLRVYGISYSAYSAGEGFYETAEMEKLVATLRRRRVRISKKRRRRSEAVASKKSRPLSRRVFTPMRSFRWRSRFRTT